MTQDLIEQRVDLAHQCLHICVGYMSRWESAVRKRHISASPELRQCHDILTQVRASPIAAHNLESVESELDYIFECAQEALATDITPL